MTHENKLLELEERINDLTERFTRSTHFIDIENQKIITENKVIEDTNKNLEHRLRNMEREISDHHCRISTLELDTTVTEGQQKKLNTTFATREELVSKYNKLGTRFVNGYNELRTEVEDLKEELTLKKKKDFSSKDNQFEREKDMLEKLKEGFYNPNKHD